MLSTEIDCAAIDMLTNGPTRVYHEGRGLDVHTAWREGVTCDYAFLRDDGWSLGFQLGHNDSGAHAVWAGDWVAVINLLDGTWQPIGRE